MNKISTLVLSISIILSLNADAQSTPCLLDANGRYVLPDGSPCPNAIVTTVPFLTIAPDARAGGMGDAGIATSADANSLAYNDSKIVFAEEKMALTLSYVPWLRALGLQDIGMSYAGFYTKLDDRQAIGASLRYFTLGSIEFLDIEGQSLGMGKPNEFEVKVAYARKLSENFSAAIAPKFIFSDLASGQRTQDGGSGDLIKVGIAFAADISVTYQKTIQTSFKRDVTFAAVLSNIGSKIAYTSTVADMLPANIGIGYGWRAHLDEANTFLLTIDIRKLLVPTPKHPADPEFDANNDGIADFRQLGTFEAIFGSFSDAPDGFAEELREITYSIGAEYWYDNQFAVRLGYFYENPLKGNRKFITAGIGLKYNIFGINLSYLVPTNNLRNPLDNTLRFTLTFDFSKMGAGETEPAGDI
jgi:hypothetical protein